MHLKLKLRVRAAANNRSMEAEARAILADALERPQASRDLARGLVETVSRTGGVNLELPRRKNRPRVADLDA
jgi:plasmid stability protein